MNHIKANFCSSTQIEKCKKCDIEMDNYHLFTCTRKNPMNITYDYILNGTILEQKNAIQYLNKNYIKEDI